MAPRILLIAAALLGCHRQLPPVQHTPPGTADVTGDGSLVSSPVGPEGRRLALGPSLPALVVPPNALTADGRVFTIEKKESPQLQGTPLSVAFEIAPPT